MVEVEMKNRFNELHSTFLELNGAQTILIHVIYKECFAEADIR